MSKSRPSDQNAAETRLKPQRYLHTKTESASNNLRCSDKVTCSQAHEIFVRISYCCDFEHWWTKIKVNKHFLGKWTLSKWFFLKDGVCNINGLKWSTILFADHSVNYQLDSICSAFISYCKFERKSHHFAHWKCLGYSVCSLKSNYNN